MGSRSTNAEPITIESDDDDLEMIPYLNPAINFASMHLLSTRGMQLTC